MTPVSSYLAESLQWVFIAVLVLNMTQRRHQTYAERKRFATLYIALLVFVLFLTSQAVVLYGGRDWMLVPVVVVLVGVGYYFRSRVWPFRLHCVKTGKRLTWQEIMYHDSNVCEEARNTEDSGDE